MERGEGGVVWVGAEVGDHCVAQGDGIVCYWTEGRFHLIEVGGEGFRGEIFVVFGWWGGGIQEN